MVTMTWSAEKTPEVTGRAAEAKKTPPKRVKTIAQYLPLNWCEAINLVDVPDENNVHQVHAPFMDVAECDWALAMTAESVPKSMGMWKVTCPMRRELA